MKVDHDHWSKVRSHDLDSLFELEKRIKAIEDKLGLEWRTYPHHIKKTYED